MTQISPDDFVVILESNEVGVVTEIRNDPLTYMVRIKGEIHAHGPHEISGLTVDQVNVLDMALGALAKAIDLHHGEDVYNPIYDENGEILYSSSAASAMSAIAYPKLILALGQASEQIHILSQRIQELESNHD